MDENIGVRGQGVDELHDVAAGNTPRLRGAVRRAFGGTVLALGLVVMSPTAAAWNLGDLNGSNGFRLMATEHEPVFDIGQSLSPAGDLNGDGLDDFVVGAVNYNWVVFGRDSKNGVTFPAELDMTGLNGRTGMRLGILGNPVAAVSNAGDINGDGLDDILVGAGANGPSTSGYTGETYVVFGRDATAGRYFPAQLSVQGLDGNSGFIIQGVQGHNAAVGASLAGGGDVNGDGINDMLLGATGTENYVVFGRDANDDPFPARLQLAALEAADGFEFRVNDGGFAISSVGDINGDGIGDVVVGRWAATVDGKFRAGQVAVLFGRDTINGPSFPQVVSVDDFNGSNGFVVNGLVAGDNIGRSVAAAGDVNGDGVGDLIFDAPGAEHNGASDRYVIFGRNVARDGQFPTAFNLATLNGSNGFVLRGAAGEQLEFHYENVSGAGDVNADGVDDLLVGAPGKNGGDGAVYVVFGRNQSAGKAFPAVLDLRALPATDGFMISGEPGTTAGSAVSAAGDVNHDGIADFLVGAQAGRGYAYVVYGRAGGPSATYSSVLCPGDINADGVSDLAMVNSDGQAKIKNFNGQLVNQFTFSDPSVVAVKLMPDINGNGAPELVGMAADSHKAEVFDTLTGAKLATVSFDAKLKQVDVEVVADQNGNGVPEIASLGQGSGKVQIKDALTSQLLRTDVFFGADFKAVDLAVYDDLTGDGKAKFGVLGENNAADVSDKLAVRDLATGERFRTLQLGKGWTVQQQAVVNDLNGNGTQELAVMRVKGGDAVNVTIRDSKTNGVLNSIGLSRVYAPYQLLVVPDINGNGSDEVVVYGKTASGEQAAQLRDSKTGEQLRSVWFNKAFPAQDVATCGDNNGNGAADIVVLGKRASDGKLRAMVQDSKTGALIKTVDY